MKLIIIKKREKKIQKWDSLGTKVSPSRRKRLYNGVEYTSNQQQV